MKRILIFSLMFLSYQNFAVAIQKNALVNMAPRDDINNVMPVHNKINIISSNTTNKYFNQTYFRIDNTDTYIVDFKQSQIQLSETTLIPVFLQRKNPSVWTDNTFTEQNAFFTGANARYQTDRFSFEIAYLNKSSAQQSAEMLVLQSSYMVWSAEDFNLAINGEIVTGNNIDFTKDILGINAPNNIGESIIINSSLSLSGSYLLTESWVVTGTVSSSFLNDELTKSLSQKSSDNMALIGTTYSF